VGTGQSEIAIKNMVDFFLLLIQPGSGDELQGIKKGIVEMADAIAITKADGDNVQQAKTTQSDFQHALHLLKKQPSGWTPKVRICSALKKTELSEIEEMLEEYRLQVSASGFLQSNRRAQYIHWFQEHFNYLLLSDPRQFPSVTETADTTARNLSPCCKTNGRSITCAGCVRRLCEGRVRFAATREKKALAHALPPRRHL
jgi:LAO/AO transport system kinase